MRTLRLFFLVVFCSVAGFGQTQPGIEISDLNRSADPCTDFYEYSNGTWRANNPIPATMDRWSRRWAAGETNKEQLACILEEASARSDLRRKAASSS